MNSGSVPFYFKWLSYLSWFRYGNEALLINQWADVGPGEIVCNRLNATCPADGRVVLQTLNFDVVRFSLSSYFRNDYLKTFWLNFIFRTISAMILLDWLL